MLLAVDANVDAGDPLLAFGHPRLHLAPRHRPAVVEARDLAAVSAVFLLSLCCLFA